MRHLNQEAAKAVKWGGMNEVEALKLVTLNPAKQLGIDARVGSIEVGKDADLVLYDGHPLAMHSVVQKTFVDGHLYFDIEVDKSRQTTIAAIKERMTSKDKKPDAKPTGAGSGAQSAPSPEVRWADEPYTCEEVR
jgi:adenine deaminase